MHSSISNYKILLKERLSSFKTEDGQQVEAISIKTGEIGFISKEDAEVSKRQNPYQTFDLGELGEFFEGIYKDEESLFAPVRAQIEQILKEVLEKVHKKFTARFRRFFLSTVGTSCTEFFENLEDGVLNDDNAFKKSFETFFLAHSKDFGNRLSSLKNSLEHFPQLVTENLLSWSDEAVNSLELRLEELKKIQKVLIPVPNHIHPPTQLEPSYYTLPNTTSRNNHSISTSSQADLVLLMSAAGDLRAYNPEKKEYAYSSKIPEIPRDSFNSVVISPSGDSFVVTGRYSSRIFIGDLKTGTITKKKTKIFSNAMLFTASWFDESTLVLGGSDSVRVLYDLHSEQVKKGYAITNGRKDGCFYAVGSIRQEWIVTGSSHGLLEIFHYLTEEKIFCKIFKYTLGISQNFENENEAQVSSISVSPNQLYFAVTAERCVPQVYACFVPEKKVLRVIVSGLEPDYEAIAWSPGSNFLLLGHEKRKKITIIPISVFFDQNKEHTPTCSVVFETNPALVDGGRPNDLFSFGFIHTTGEILALDRAGNVYIAQAGERNKIKNT